MKCYLCGHELSPQDKFCPNCGEKNLHYEEKNEGNFSNPEYPNEVVRNQVNFGQKKSATSATVVAVYSIIMGVLSFLGNISQQTNSNFFTYIIIGIMIGFGIVILNYVKRGDYKEKGFVITLFVFYCFDAFLGFLFLLIPLEALDIPLLTGFKYVVFFLIEALVVTPIIFSIRYLQQAGRGE